MSLWTEFKEFAIKGNVIDLAVGVIIGGAFGKITTSLVNDVVMPPIGTLLGGSDMAKKEIVLRPEVKDAAGKVVEQGASLKYGAFVNTIFDFVLIALVIFALVKLINYARRSEPAKPPDPTKTETLLAEIRDLLKRQQGSPLRARHNPAARRGPPVRPAAAHRRSARPAAPAPVVSRPPGLWRAPRSWPGRRPRATAPGMVARQGMRPASPTFGAALFVASTVAIVSACDLEPPGGRKGPALARAVEATSLEMPPPSPGSVRCAEGVECPVTKAGRKICCHAPGSPPMCRDGAKCGQNNGHRYDAMLACDETADCTGVEPGKDVVCCLSDDGAKAGVKALYNRGACVPRSACAGPSTLACRSNAECPGGLRCRPMAMASGLSVGACVEN